MPVLRPAANGSFTHRFLRKAELPSIYAVASIMIWVYYVHPNYLECYKIKYFCYPNTEYNSETKQYDYISTTCMDDYVTSKSLRSYFLTLNLGFALGGLLENLFVKWSLSGLSVEEFDTFLIYTLAATTDSLNLLHRIWDAGFNMIVSRDFYQMWVCYMLLLFGVNVIMNRCHTICLKLHNGYDEQGLGLMKNVGVGLLTCLMLCTLFCGYKSYLQSGMIQLYGDFILRFYLLMHDLMYSYRWCVAEVEGFKVYGLPGHGNERKVLKTEQSICQHMWIFYKCTAFALLFWSRYFSNPYIYFFAYLFLITRIGGTCHSLLGYQITMNMKLDGVTKRNLRRTDKDCIVCLDELVHNDKDSTSEFVEGDAVKIPACGHIFHYECLMKWMEQKKECPTCKTSVFKRVNVGTDADDATVLAD